MFHGKEKIFLFSFLLFLNHLLLVSSVVRKRSSANFGSSSDCSYGLWSSFGECSQVCGSGVQSRIRQVVVQNADNTCTETVENVPCNTQTCLDCVVSEWSEWSDCSSRCGSGIQIQTRKVVRMNQPGGVVCPNLKAEKNCNTEICTQNDCIDGDWGEWTLCNKPCGSGNQTRLRAVDFPFGFNGCVAKSETKLCNTNDCPPPAAPSCPPGMFMFVDSSLKTNIKCDRSEFCPVAIDDGSDYPPMNPTCEASIGDMFHSPQGYCCSKPAVLRWRNH